MTLDTSRIDQHAIPNARRVTQPVRHGTGLYQAGLINGRPAQDWEIEARERVYQQQRDDEAALLDIRPWSTSRRNDAWAGALKAARSLKAEAGAAS